MAANDRETLQALNENYVRSVAESDVRWFDENLSQDFLNTNPDCTIIDRAGFLARISNPAGVTDLHPEDVNIRLFGDFAIIHARTPRVHRAIRLPGRTSPSTATCGTTGSPSVPCRSPSVTRVRLTVAATPPWRAEGIAGVFSTMPPRSVTQ